VPVDWREEYRRLFEQMARMRRLLDAARAESQRLRDEAVRQRDDTRTQRAQLKRQPVDFARYRQRRDRRKKRG
jgi:hypothetical protein